jgi:hypothetical protein
VPVPTEGMGVFSRIRLCLESLVGGSIRLGRSIPFDSLASSTQLYVNRYQESRKAMSGSEVCCKHDWK